ncbi:MAG TPA: hypothetical protein VKC90_12765 [Chitinophagaceae bacterium]|nr:hypothetical protein [Chitinophagaceae bacterium]
MKKVYFKIPILLLFIVIVFFLYKDLFQCPGGRVPKFTGYGTTIAFGSDIGIIPKNTTNAINEQSGAYSFRIKQIYSNGHTRFSDINQPELTSSGSRKFNFYPTPIMALLVSNLQIISTENYSSEFFNMQEQAIVNNEILISGDIVLSNCNVTKGVNWLKLMDVTSNFPV